MLHLVEQIQEATAAIRRQWSSAPSVGIILGSGLGGLAEEINEPIAIEYGDIPHFPRSTAIGHQGRLVCGTLAGVPAVAMQGRFHLYEGYSAAQATLPVRVMHELGIQLLVVSNASGGLNPNFAAGDVMLIDDHIDLMHTNPLVGVNDDQLGPRFPDMSVPYDPALIDQARGIARREDFPVHVGVYAALKGPNYETRAEYRYLRHIGADAAGMSTVPEVIVAAHQGTRVLAMSAITNICLPDALSETKGEDVVAVAGQAAAKMRAIVVGVLTEPFECSHQVRTRSND